MDFKQFISEDCKMRLVSSDVSVSENLKYHLEHGLGLYENVFRVYSKAYFELIEEVRNLYENDKIAISDEELDLIETDIGSFAEYKGRKVRLDAPFEIKERLNESDDRKVKIGKPFRTPGESKKFAVYVRSSSGNVKKVRFGDPNLKVKNNDPARAKSFRARHKCSEKKDRTKAGYWACRIGRYAKSVGLSSSRPW